MHRCLRLFKEDEPLSSLLIHLEATEHHELGIFQAFPKVGALPSLPPIVCGCLSNINFDPLTWIKPAGEPIPTSKPRGRPQVRYGADFAKVCF